MAVNGANGGLKARSKYIKGSKLVEVFGPLHYDLVNSNCLHLNGLPLKTGLHGQRDSLVLMADDPSIDCRVRIIRKIQGHPKIYIYYTRLLSNQTRCYEDIFRSARNIKFKRGEGSCGSITK